MTQEEPVNKKETGRRGRKRRTMDSSCSDDNELRATPE